MRKFVICLLAVTVLMLLPISSIAGMTVISDSDMAAVTGQEGVDICSLLGGGIINTAGIAGQEGVDIAADDLHLKIDLAGAGICYGDTDGLGTTHGGPGYLGVIFSPDSDYMNIDIGSMGITIDVDADGGTALRIGLASGLSLDIDNFAFEVYLDSKPHVLYGEGAASNSLGCISMTGFHLGLNSDATILISTH